jgi:L-aspartate oxidase
VASTSPQQIELSAPQSQSQLKLYAETVNLLDIAYLILKSAAFRTESRGGHYRLDYPDTLAIWQKHTIVKHHEWTTAPLS